MTATVVSRTVKVAPVTVAFWIAKVCATTLGETAGDLFSMTLALGYASSSLLLLALLAVALGAQLRARRFHPARFWLVVVLTSTAGTTLSDFVDRSLGFGYATGTALLSIALATSLLLWWAAEGSIEVTQVHTRRQEAFYWSTILCSNTLGTALGDCLAEDSGLGFAGGALLIGGLLALLAVAWRCTRLDRVLLFWFAFVLTRPFGASFGDVLTKPTAHGGLALGTVGASAALLVLLVLAVCRPARRNHLA
ncbi:MAG: hypothetical protein AB7I32_13190 [Gammaproteobacteria bacterium]